MNHNQRFDDEYDYPSKPSQRTWYVIVGAMIAVVGIAAMIVCFVPR